MLEGITPQPRSTPTAASSGSWGRDVVAIDRLHDTVEFQLKTIDTNVCVGDCTSDDLAEFLDQQSTTTTTTPPSQRGSTTSTAPPRDLTPPAVDPTVPTTSTTTTVPAPVPDDTRVPTPTAPHHDRGPTRGRATAGPAVRPRGGSRSGDTSAPGRHGTAGDRSSAAGGHGAAADDHAAAGHHGSAADRPSADRPSAHRPATDRSPPTPDPGVGPRSRPPGGVRHRDDRRQSVPRAPVRVPATGSPRGGSGPNGTVQVVYSQDVVIEWTDRSASPSVTKPTTIPGVPGCSRCGSRPAVSRPAGSPTSRHPTPRCRRSRSIPNRRTKVEAFNAGVAYEVPGDWEVASANWSGGDCGGRTAVEENATIPAGHVHGHPHRCGVQRLGRGDLHEPRRKLRRAAADQGRPRGADDHDDDRASGEHPTTVTDSATAPSANRRLARTQRQRQQR